MKNLLVLCGLFLLCGNAYALENCTAISLDSPKASDVRSPNERFQVDNNMVYICDKDIGSEECDYDSVILYKGKAVYCKDQSGYSDTWVDKAIPDCTDDDYNIRLKNKTIKPCGGYLVHSYFVEENGACVCKNSAGHSCAYALICRPSEKYMKCQAAIERGEPAEWDANNKECHCHDRSGVEYNWSGDKCVQKNTQVTKPTCPEGSSLDVISKEKCTSEQDFECTKFDDKGKCLCGKCTPKKESGGDNGSGSDTVGKCHPSVCKSEICRACCAKPSNETIWDRTGQVCQCMNGGNFIKENNQWICKVDSSQVAGPKEDCDPTLLAKVKDWVLQCSSYLNKPGADELVSELDRILEYCEGQNVKNDVFLRLYDDLKEMVDKVCVESTVAPQPVEDNNAGNVANAKKRISKLHESLDSMRSGFKRSVWRDKDGDFNTSRLLSDSIAGVVLGTAGGLITSNVVKKNQVEDGFEDIQCTIGGQVVATWGDEFRVGIQ